MLFLILYSHNSGLRAETTWHTDSSDWLRHTACCAYTTAHSRHWADYYNASIRPYRTYLEVKRSKVKVTRRTNAHTVNAQYLPNEKAYELQTWDTDEARRPASAISAVTSMSKVKGQGRKVTWRVWEVLADKSRTKHPSNTKIGRKVVHLTGNNAHQFKSQMSKVKVTKPTNAETGSVQYLSVGKAYELQTWCADGARRPASASSTVTSKVKGQGRKITWCVNRCWPLSRERNILATPKLVGRLSTPRKIMSKRSKVKLDYCWD